MQYIRVINTLCIHYIHIRDTLQPYTHAHLLVRDILFCYLILHSAVEKYQSVVNEEATFFVEP